MKARALRPTELVAQLLAKVSEPPPNNCASAGSHVPLILKCAEQRLRQSTTSGSNAERQRRPHFLMISPDDACTPEQERVAQRSIQHKSAYFLSDKDMYDSRNAKGARKWKTLFSPNSKVAHSYGVTARGPGAR